MTARDLIFNSLDNSENAKLEERRRLSVMLDCLHKVSDSEKKSIAFQLVDIAIGRNEHISARIQAASLLSFQAESLGIVGLQPIAQRLSEWLQNEIVDYPETLYSLNMANSRMTADCLTEYDLLFFEFLVRAVFLADSNQGQKIANKISDLFKGSRLETVMKKLIEKKRGNELS
jgi:hypothetical protein